jgi:hypothetical protein
VKYGISVRIDVTQILKERLFKGEKGTYLDLTTFIETTEPDKYGNHGFISQSQTQDERQAGAPKTPILGNCKVFWRGESDEARQQGYDKGMPAAREAMASEPPPTDNFQDQDIPF